MNRVDQSQGSKLSQTDRQTDRQTDFPLVEGPKPKALELENASASIWTSNVLYQLVFLPASGRRKASRLEPCTLDYF